MIQRRALPRIRAATTEDLPGLPALEAAADRLLEVELGCRPFPAPEQANLVGVLFVLVAGSPPVGFARVDEVGGQVHLEQLSVHPDFAGRGVGRSLVQGVLAEARRRGYQSMTLCTFAGVPFNAPFYASCGFELVAEPSGALAATREHEAQAGLDELGRRIAMRIKL